MLFEIVFGFSNYCLNNQGLSIIVLSLTINALVLPLYRRADKMQEEERELQLKLKGGAEHIKKTFKGDERMMMLQTYYRQNNYNPLYSLRGIISLLLQIPFFIAAYQFLSTLQTLNGASFGIIKDMSAPDGLLKIGGLTVNLLPIIMTAINFVSSYIYSKGYPLKTKLQLYITALFFLVFLYNSPSGLVFYWTLNNAFSLLKTIILKFKKPKKITVILISIVGAVLTVVLLFTKSNFDSALYAIYVFVSLLFQLPLIIYILLNIHKKENRKTEKQEASPNKKLFLSGCLALCVFRGFLIPSFVIQSSPREFVFQSVYMHPLWYLVASFCLAFGLYFIWFSVFYFLGSDNAKRKMEMLVWIITVSSIINYMAFGRKLGNLNSTLFYTTGMNFSTAETVINLVVIAVAVLVLYYIFSKWKKPVTGILLVIAITFSTMGFINSADIYKESKDTKYTAQSEKLSVNLSKNQKNVVVIMLDCALGVTVPYIFNELPQLKKQFDGFTYYNNVISFGPSTVYGSPSVFGGYEYTPIELNSRSKQELVEKHNESLKVLPVLFDSKGFDVSVCNPTLANYQQWIPDTSIYADYPDIKTYSTLDTFTDKKRIEGTIETTKETFLIYGIMKCLPVFLQPILYNGSNYFQNNSGQYMVSNTVSNGESIQFLNSYNVLKELPNITTVTDKSSGSALFMTNDTAHDPILLQAPGYEPAEHVDNTEYEAKHKDRYNLNGKSINMETSYQYTYYHANAATFIRLGKWFDSLKQKGVYDNTKIILVSDHGFRLRHSDELIIDNVSNFSDGENYFPLLLVKDYNSKGFNTSDDFMTNADVATIATKDVIKNPINPFTNKEINDKEKTAHNQYIIVSDWWRSEKHLGSGTFEPARWYSVHDSIWNNKNWKCVAEKDVLTKENISNFE